MYEKFMEIRLLRSTSRKCSSTSSAGRLILLPGAATSPARRMDRSASSAPTDHSPIGRRQCIRTLGTVGLIASVGVLAPACTERDARDLADLILAAVIQFAVDKLTYALNEAIGGIIELKNDDEEEVTGELELELISSEGLEEDQGSSSYTVPPKTVNTYAWSGLRSNTPGSYNVLGRSALNELSSPTITIA